MTSEAAQLLRILLVEDDTSIALIIKIGMRNLQMPYHLDIAYSAEEGLQLWHAGAYDLVMTDYNLRGKNGIDLLSAIRKENSVVPTVLFTAYDSPQNRKAATDVGVTHFVAKPFFVDEFINLARSLLPIKASQLGG